MSFALIFCLGFNAFCVQDAMADAVNGGGLYVGKSSTLNYEGKRNLSGFIASSNGGGIYNIGTLNLNGGTVSANKANYGGGVFSDGTFTMNGGTISDNEASYGGGGVELRIGHRNNECWFNFRQQGFRWCRN